VVSTSAVLSVDSLTSIHEFERNNRILSVQPNPFCQYLDITSEDELSGVTINIYNPNGNLVLCHKVKTISQTYKLNLPELMKGMYLIEVSGVSGDKQFSETRKIIKSN
jgi:hypothetical protein